MNGPLNEADIFLAALEIDAPESRAEYLDVACGDDSNLRQRIETLLRQNAESAGVLDAPPPGLAATIELPPMSEELGTLIGPYKLLQQIGEGGMGVVFMAEQTAPIQRTVALKIIKPGMDTRQVIARFEAERQALAMMDHPNIATVLDAGTTDSGRPYFVMDLVKGVPITDYCDQQHLSVRERLELVVAVCLAVQHAHQKGIIHRDIKPSNVLVAEYDGKPVPKIIDFGVAKATAQRLTERTMFTQYGQIVGTFEYMSPEQARFNQLDIDTRSDIYSLGVLLYELLAGSTPLEKDRLRTAAFDEILRIIGEEEPPRPSTRLSSSDALPSIAANRHTEPDRLSKEVSGELDWIVMKCLEKDRNRRYETATGLADDVHRYLADLPVNAGRPTRIYRTKKFIRRHKVGVLTGSAMAAAIVIGLVLASIGLVRARREAVRADREANIARGQAVRSEQFAHILQRMLLGAGPSVARGRDPTLLRELLDQTAGLVQQQLKEQPEIQADVSTMLGAVYWDIGAREPAVVMYQRAVDGYRLAGGNESLQVARALGSLGCCQCLAGDVSSGKANSQLGLDIARKLGDRDTLAIALGNMARSFNSTSTGSAAAIPFLREAIALDKEIGSDPVAIAEKMTWLAGCVASTGQPGSLDDAASLTLESLAICRQHLDSGDPRIADGMEMLGQLRRALGQPDEAVAAYREAYETYRKYGLPGQFETLRTIAELLAMQGKWDEAVDLIDEQFKNSPSNAATLYRKVGEYLHTHGWPDSAVAALRKPIELEPGNATDHFMLAAALETQKKGEEAITHYSKAIELKSDYTEAYTKLGYALYGEGKSEEALKALRKAVELEPSNPVCCNLLAWVLATTPVLGHRDPARAVELASSAVKLASDDGNYWNTLGVARYRAGNWQDAVGALEKSVDLRKGGDASDWFFLAMANWQLGRKVDARAWNDRAVAWMDKNQPKNEELTHFRAEAAELLGIVQSPNPKPSTLKPKP